MNEKEESGPDSRETVFEPAPAGARGGTRFERGVPLTEMEASLPDSDTVDGTSPPLSPADVAVQRAQARLTLREALRPPDASPMPMVDANRGHSVAPGVRPGETAMSGGFFAAGDCGNAVDQRTSTIAAGLDPRAWERPDAEDEREANRRAREARTTQKRYAALFIGVIVAVALAIAFLVWKHM